MKTTLTVTLETGLEKTTVCKDIEHWVVREAPLDLPKPGATYLDRMFCSDPVRIGRVMRARRELVSILKRELTEALMKALESKDTIQGYER